MDCIEPHRSALSVGYPCNGCLAVHHGYDSCRRFYVTKERTSRGHSRANFW